MELVGLDIAVKQQIYKLASISLCPNIAGQVVDLMVRPPKPGDDSHDQFQRETQATFESLKKRRPPRHGPQPARRFRFRRNCHRHRHLKRFVGRHLTCALGLRHAGAGVTCNPAEGATYLFPPIRLQRRCHGRLPRPLHGPVARLTSEENIHF